MASPQKYLLNRRSENQVSEFDLILSVKLSIRIRFKKPSVINDYDAMAHPSGFFATTNLQKTKRGSKTLLSFIVLHVCRNDQIEETKHVFETKISNLHCYIVICRSSYTFLFQSFSELRLGKDVEGKQI